MIIIWGCSLAVLLNKLWKNLFRLERIKESCQETVKRYGVYYMCIEDLPL